MLKCGMAMKLQSNVITEVTGKIERWRFEFENIKPEIMKYELADNLPTTTEMSKVDILIGNDYYNDIVSMKQIEITDTLRLFLLRIGWILTGRTKTNKFISKNLIMLTNFTGISTQFEAFSKDGERITSNMQPHLEEFWKLKTIGIKEPCKGTDDNKALENWAIEKR